MTNLNEAEQRALDHIEGYLKNLPNVAERLQNDLEVLKSIEVKDDNSHYLKRIYHLLSFPIINELDKAEKTLIELNSTINKFISSGFDTTQKSFFNSHLTLQKETEARIKELNYHLKGVSKND